MDMQYVQGKPLFTYINKNKKQYPYFNLNVRNSLIFYKWEMDST